MSPIFLAKRTSTSYTCCLL